jgi:hypothetical protein
LETSPISPSLLLDEQQTFNEYQKMMQTEEETWRLKSRSIWLQAGDRNTKFFHRQAKARLWKNKIDEIKGVNGITCRGQNQLKSTAKEHFEKLYTEDGEGDIEAQESLLHNIPTLITQEDNESLIQSVTEAEVLGALQQMNLDKAPGPDGFTVHFYLLCWNIVKRDLVRMVQYVQKSARMGGNINSSFLALVPKESNPSSFARFRPISLCNVSYKLISKIIAIRLKPHLHKLISPNQGGFVEK